MYRQDTLAEHHGVCDMLVWQLWIWMSLKLAHYRETMFEGRCFFRFRCVCDSSTEISWDNAAYSYKTTSCTGIFF